MRVPRTMSSVLTILLILHSLRHTQRLIRTRRILAAKAKLEVRSRDFEHAIFVWRGGRTETEREARECHPNQHGAYVRQVGNTCTRKKCCNLECCRYKRFCSLYSRRKLFLWRRWLLRFNSHSVVYNPRDTTTGIDIISRKGRGKGRGKEKTHFF